VPAVALEAVLQMNAAKLRRGVAVTLRGQRRITGLTSTDDRKAQQ
jgi:hypothetical protein